MSRDPLEGRRRGINSGELKQLSFKDEGNGCPVKVGDTFEMRSCHIEITDITRRKRGKGESGEWYFVAQFTRYRKASKPYLLGPHGYTHDPKQAIKADLVEEADPYEPEPEAIPPHEVAELPSTVAAQARFAALKQQEEQQRRMRQLSHKMRVLQKRAERHGTDLTEEIDAVESLLLQVERRLPIAA